jgi:hypothetical protein
MMYLQIASVNAEKRRLSCYFLQRASRQRFYVDAHLSCGERHAGRDHPAPGAHPEGHGGEDRYQARDQAAAATWPHTRIVWRGDSHYGRVEAPPAISRKSERLI